VEERTFLRRFFAAGFNISGSRFRNDKFREWYITRHREFHEITDLLLTRVINGIFIILENTRSGIFAHYRYFQFHINRVAVYAPLTDAMMENSSTLKKGLLPGMFVVPRFLS